MSNSLRSRLFRYVGAVAAVAVAATVRYGLNPLIGDRQPFVVFYFAVILTAWHGGTGPSVLAIALATLAAAYLFIPPHNMLAVTDASDRVGIVLFVTVCSSIVAFSAASRAARRRLEGEIRERLRQEAAVEEQRRLAAFGRDVGLTLTEAGDLPTMLGRCAEEVVRHLDGASARIWTLDEAGETLELRAGAGMSAHLDDRQARVPVGRGTIGAIARERRPHRTNAVAGDPTVSDREWAAREGMVAFAGYPLIVGDRLVGVWATFARHALSDATLRAMESVAKAIALGVERLQAVEQLHRQQEWLRVTLASVGDAVIATDPEGRVVFLNAVAEGLTGWPRAEAVGAPLDEVFRIVGESSRRPVESPALRSLREGRIVGLANHTILIARDGTERAIDDSAAPIRDEAGTVLGAVLIFRDVAERREAERALEASEARKAAILDSALDAIISMDHEGRVVEWNCAAEETFGFARDRAMGRVLAELIVPPSLREAHRRGVARYLATGEGPVIGKRIEIAGLRADGEEIPIELAIARIPTEGPPLFTAHLRDITERHRNAAERERLLAESREANRAKDQFLAVLSHELRTPLNPILLAVSSMLERPAPPDELRSDLQMIKQNIALEARLIDDLLDVMRIVQGKMPLHWEVVDAHALIGQTLQICRSEVFGKTLRVNLELNATRHHINADPARLQQVFWNLIKNAVKFTPEGGTITLRTHDGDGGGEGGEPELVIEVIDTGIGIEREALGRIFDPFHQGENSITRQYGGLGLGLAICKGVIDGHGGTLSARSEGRDRGTTFTIALRPLPGPPDAGNGRADRAAAEEERATPPRKILLVEDEPATVRLMARLLRTLGHEVTTASTIAEAIAVEREGKFNLVISDIGLPDGSGLDLMRVIVARRGPVPAIALTGYGTEEDIRRSNEAGFLAHMTKPIDFTKLETMIHRITSEAKAETDRV